MGTLEFLNSCTPEQFYRANRDLARELLDGATPEKEAAYADEYAGARAALTGAEVIRLY